MASFLSSSVLTASPSVRTECEREVDIHSMSKDFYLSEMARANEKARKVLRVQWRSWAPPAFAWGFSWCLVRGGGFWRSSSRWGACVGDHSPPIREPVEEGVPGVACTRCGGLDTPGELNPIFSGGWGERSGVQQTCPV